MWHLHKSRTVQLFGDLIHTVPTEDRVVALTFDDGPSPPYTDSVLALLGAHDVPATFFVIGSSLDRHPELGRRIVDAGHELGNHSYTHPVMVARAPRTIRHEVEATDSLIRQAGAEGQILFRPPYGKRLFGLPLYLSRTGRTTVLWSLEPDSWYGTADEMVAHVLENVGPGSIVLLHVELRSRSEELCFYPDSASADRLPRFPNDVRTSWFCFTNQEEAQRLLGALPASGEATIVVDELFYIYQHTDVHNRARLSRVIGPAPPG